MTQPDGLFPDVAFNFESLAELAARSQEDWEAEITGRATGGLVNVRDGLFAGLPAGMPQPLAILTVLARTLLGIPGKVWDTVDDVLVDIQPWVAGIPILGSLVEALTGIEDGDLNDVGTAFLKLRNAFDGIDLNAPPGAVLAAIGDAIANALEGIPVIGDIIKLIRQVLRGGVPVASLVDSDPQMLSSERLFGAGSVESNPQWTLDAANSRTSDGTNAVKVIADGTIKALRSSNDDEDEILVSEGQKFTPSIYVKHTGYAGTGSPIQLHVVPFVDGVQTAPVMVASYAPVGANLAWPGHLLTGTYTVPANVTSVQVRLVVTAAATSGTIWWDEASAKLTGRIQFGWVDDLPLFRDEFGQVLSIFANIDPGPLSEALQNVHDTWNGVGADIAQGFEDFQSLLDGAWGGLARALGLGKSVADVANAATDTSNQADTALQVGEWNNAVLGLRNNKSLMSGLDETSESNFTIDSMLNGTGEPPLIAATASSQPFAFWRAEETSTKGVISWYGKGVASVTALYIDIYRFNYFTEEIELIHSSTNQIGQFPSDGSWHLGRYFVPEVSRFLANAGGSDYGTGGDVIGVAWRVTGAGTHNIAGKLGSWLPGDSITHPAKPAATLGSGTHDGQAFASLTYTGNTPWFGIGIAEGDVPPAYFAPRTTTYDTVGTFVYDVPPWANFVDDVLCSAGGGAHGGYGGVPITGEGGKAGVWATETLVRGVDFPDVPNATITFDVPAGGAGGPKEEDGADGGFARRRAISGGKAQLVALGGDGGDSYDSPVTGGSPGNITYADKNYIGGTGGAHGAPGKNGTAPGGGGGGGDGGFYTIAAPGGTGARGQVWATARQS